MSKYNRFDKVIINNPANIDATFSGMVLEVLEDNTYIVGFIYQGVQTSTQVNASQLTSFGDATYVVIASSGGSPEMRKSEITQKLQNILSGASDIQTLLESCPEVITNSTVLTNVFESLDDIARVSTGAMNDITLNSDIDMCQTHLERC